MAWVDLHLHSRCSDGADTPEMVVARAQASGMAALALTDHDTVTGVPDARAAARAVDLEFLEGVEISAAFQSREIHIIGLGIEIESPPLIRLLKTLSANRLARIEHIVDRLEKTGVAPKDILTPRLRYDTLAGRMHVAVALTELGKAKSVQHAFDKYLNRSCPAYVPKELPAAMEAIEVIHTAGGLAFIAHPGLGNSLHSRLDALLELPFDGIEAWHVSHTPQMIQMFLARADRYGLLVAGGSDCHGNIKKEKPTLGRVKVPYACYTRIIETLHNKARQ